VNSLLLFVASPSPVEKDMEVDSEICRMPPTPPLEGESFVAPSKNAHGIFLLIFGCWEGGWEERAFDLDGSDSKMERLFSAHLR